jgi:hypothetical protein
MSRKEEIQQFVGQFVEGLVKLMREQAHETVDATFGHGDNEEALTPKIASARRVNAPKQLPGPSSVDLRKQVLLAVKENPGSSSTVIASCLGKTGAQLRPLLAELAAGGAIKKTGAGPSTRYSLR